MSNLIPNPDRDHDANPTPKDGAVYTFGAGYQGRLGLFAPNPNPNLDLDPNPSRTHKPTLKMLIIKVGCNPDPNPDPSPDPDPNPNPSPTSSPKTSPCP